MLRFKRALEERLLEELASRPAVFLSGPRQAGKSTLAREIAEKHLRADYTTFDNLTALAAASSDPEGFLRSFRGAAVIDEAQRVPDIFRALKLVIDEQRARPARPRHGRFLLTGSANVLAIPALAEALVGRVAILTLYPLSASEAFGDGRPRIDGLFDREIAFGEGLDRERGFDLDKIVRRATFPEIAADPSISSRNWFEAYLTTLLQRDIRQLAEIERIPVLPNTLKLLAARAGGLLNDADTARDAGLNPMTYRRYRMLLQALFLIALVPPWHRNIGKRLVKSPKLFLLDTALLCHLLGVDATTLKKQNPALFGRVLENFVASELMKQLTLLADGTLYHFRTHDGKEVDFVIERRNGSLLGIEVKGSEKVSETDFEGLKALRAQAGKDFIRGIVLYLGRETVPFGAGLAAMPIGKLWRDRASR